MTLPLVSIGLITYNRGDIVHSAIEQLLAQTYTNIELIISDNASTDNTQDVCERFAKKDSRIRYIRQQHNVGMYGNFNFVLSQAQGAYFLWATDDDEWDAEFIATLVDLHQQYPQAVVAGCNYRLLGRTTFFDVDYKFASYTHPLTSIRNCMATGPIISYGLQKTEIVRKTGGFYYYPLFIPAGIGESLLVYRILLQGGVAFCQRRLWRKRDSGYSFERYDVLKSNITDFQIRKRIVRYLTLPLLLHFDLMIMCRDSLMSDFRLVQKCVLIYWSIRMYVKFMTEYVVTLFTGGIIVVKSLFRLF